MAPPCSPSHRRVTPPPLSDLLIVDFSRVLAGPFATMMLGDLGAEVIKIERPGIGDDTRSWAPPRDEAGNATYFQSVNRNKRSLALDLTDPSDLAHARVLVARADVLVENFRPGLIEALGLGYEDLRHENPGLVYCSVSGFGRKAGAQLPAYDLLLQALGGLMSITGPPDREPQKVGVALVDVLAGLFASVGILAALRHRERTGQGQRVEVTMLVSLLSALVNQGSAYTLAGVVPQRMGNAHPSISPYEIYPTGDGDLVLAVGTDRQFVALCGVLNAQELASDHRFATNESRVQHRDALRAALTHLLQREPADAWARELTEARVPAGVVNDLEAAFGLAEELGLDPLVEIPRGDGTVARLTRNPIELSESPVSYRACPPPLPGSS